MTWQIIALALGCVLLLYILNTLAEIKSSTQAIKAIMKSILEATEDEQTRDVEDFDSRQ